MVHMYVLGREDEEEQKANLHAQIAIARRSTFVPFSLDLFALDPQITRAPVSLWSLNRIFIMPSDTNQRVRHNLSPPLSLRASYVPGSGCGEMVWSCSRGMLGLFWGCDILHIYLLVIKMYERHRLRLLPSLYCSVVLFRCQLQQLLSL